MNLQQQADILNLYNQYQDTDHSTIKTNIKTYIDQSSIKPAILSKLTGIPLQTIYQLRKSSAPYKPDFITALIICNVLEISITALYVPLLGQLNQTITEHKTKWTSQNKQQFLTDYNSPLISMDELCDKYSITTRTAGEYNRQFNMDICGQVEE